MNVVVDTSVIIAGVTNEPHKSQLIEATRSAELIAPASQHAEIGNAFSATFKRKRIGLVQALAAVRVFQLIPRRLSEIELEQGLELAERLGIYAYDAYFLSCALKYRCPLISLDGGLLDAAGRAGVQTIEVE